MADYSWRFGKWVLGLLSLYIDSRLRKRRNRRPFDIVAVDSLMRLCLGKPQGRAFTARERENYQTAARYTVFWHGTGRLQHSRDGSVIDVLCRY